MTKKFSNIIIWGDIHSNIDPIKNFIHKFQLTDTLFIQVGDFGIGFKWQDSEKILERYQSFFKNTRNYLWAIRGNHDNPAYFNGNYEFDNLWLIPDYTIETINNKKFLFIGGATSVDRRLRNGYKTGNGGDYWFGEELIYNDKIKTLGEVNVIITHTNPKIYAPMSSGKFGLDFLKNQPMLLKDIKKEQSILNDVFNELKDKNLKYWFLGHFHKNNQIEIEKVKFIQLGIQDYYELKI